MVGIESPPSLKRSPGWSSSRRRIGSNVGGSPERVDEAQRLRLAAQDLVQRPPGLLQREVERRRLERPPAPAPRHVPARLDRPQLQLGDPVAQRLQRPLAGERELRRGLVQRVGLVLERRNVLADALRAVAAKLDLGRHAPEVVGEGGGEPLELVRLDQQRQRAELGPGHPSTLAA